MTYNQIKIITSASSQNNLPDEVKNLIAMAREAKKDLSKVKRWLAETTTLSSRRSIPTKWRTTMASAMWM